MKKSEPSDSEKNITKGLTNDHQKDYIRFDGINKMTNITSKSQRLAQMQCKTLLHSSCKFFHID